MNSSLIVKGAKGMVWLITGVFTYIYKSITGLMFVLFLFMIVDYVTGVLAAANNQSKEEKLNSRKGINGIKKKVGYLILLLCAILLDFTLSQIANVNFLFINNIAYGVFSLAVTIFLMGNEAISILENLGKIGVPIPEFLVKAFKDLKEKSEDIAGQTTNSLDKPGETNGK